MLNSKLTIFSPEESVSRPGKSSSEVFEFNFETESWEEIDKEGTLFPSHIKQVAVKFTN